MDAAAPAAGGSAGASTDGAAMPSGGSRGDGSAPRDSSPASGDALGSSGTPPEAGAAARPCAFTLCETFEDVPVGGRPSSAVWSSVGAGIVVDEVHAFRGTKALHIPPTLKGSHMISTSKGLPMPGKNLFGRVFFWIENAPPFGKGYLHWTLAQSLGKNAAGNSMQHNFGGEAYGGKPSTYLSYNSWSPAGYSGFSKAHSVGIPLKAWQCVEWHYDTTQSKATFWWNGAELTSLGFTNPPGMTQFNFPDFTKVSIGWTEYHDPLSPWEVWIDEIALHSERIGCDR